MADKTKYLKPRKVLEETKFEEELYKLIKKREKSRT